MVLKRAQAHVNVQFKREVAHQVAVQKTGFPRDASCRNVPLTTRLSSHGGVVHSQDRYPSPGRPAYSPSRPMTVFRRLSALNVHDIGYQGDLGVTGRSNCINCDANSETTIGLRLCRRHQSSLRQWQYSVWQVALKQIWNAVLSAPARAFWPLTYLELTQQQRRWPAQQRGFSATMQAFVAALANYNAPFGVLRQLNRRQGFALAAVLRFGD